MKMYRLKVYGVDGAQIPPRDVGTADVKGINVDKCLKMAAKIVEGMGEVVGSISIGPEAIFVTIGRRRTTRLVKESRVRY